jgi:hypothetical protein
MSGAMKTKLAVAVATFGVVGALGHAVSPPSTPAGHQRELERQAAQALRDDQENRRFAGQTVGQAVYQDSLHAREVRGVEDAAARTEADRIVESALRRIP